MSEDERIYVIQKHDASNLHYDLRLEFEGVLWSWAVPKKPPKESGNKRLAIKVDDHDLGYADFEGEIKEGYGEGTVEIWDGGSFEQQDVKDDKIVFTIHGDRLSGDYVLVKMNTKGDQENWLFFKKNQ